MPSSVRIEMFGGLRIVPAHGGAAIEVPPHRAGILLALLALQPGRSITREVLIDKLWPEDGEEESRRRLRQTLHELRAVLDPATTPEYELIESSRASISIKADLLRTDVMEFDAAVLGARNMDPHARLITLQTAVGLYRGELLPGFYLDEVQSEQRRLQASMHAALKDIANACTELGDGTAAVEALHRLVILDPLAEDVHCGLMRLYADMGRPSDVIRQYNTLERTLREELNETPLESTKDLAKELRRQTNGRTASPSSSPGLHKSDSVSPPTGAGTTAQENNGNAVTAEHARYDRESAAPHAHSRNKFSTVSVTAAMVCGAVLIAAGWVGAHLANGLRRDGGAATSTVPTAPTASGSEAWTQRYVPAADERDSEPTAIAIDSARDVYIAGFVQTRDHDVDYLVLKYDRNGGPLLWRARYDGPSHDVDRARAVAIDNDGNVLVTGESDNGKGNGATRLSGLDYATIKLNGKTGERLWEARYNSDLDGEDRPVRIAVDDDGNSYVTGSSWDHKLSGSGSAFAFATVKYDRDGQQLWAQRFGPDESLYYDATDMALDKAQRRVYVAGVGTDPSVKNGKRDLVLASYDLDGKLLWKHIFAGNEDKYDSKGSARVMLDGHGGVIIAGSSMIAERSRASIVMVADLYRDGHEEWRRWQYGSSPKCPLTVTAAAADSRGDVTIVSWEYIPSGSSSVYSLCSVLTANHAIIETADPSVGAPSEYPTAVGRDQDGGIVVTGYNTRVRSGSGPNPVPELLTAKYSSRLHELWRSSSYIGKAQAMAISPDGSPVVTAQVAGHGTNDILTIQYNP